MEELQIRKRIKRWIIFFIIAIWISGITASPAESELAFILPWVKSFSIEMHDFLSKVYQGVKETNLKYPQVAYGFDWLAFAHIVIGIAFFGPYKHPVRNTWIIDWGIIACILVIPFALICNPIRHLPWYWTLIDCSFGIFGIIPLLRVRYLISQLHHHKS